MYATERSERFIGVASAIRSTGSRNLFALAGVMLRLTTGRAGSGCDTVIVADVRSAPGGITSLKLPAETTPPRSPIRLVEVVCELEPRRPPSPSTCDEPSSEIAAVPEALGAEGCVG